MPMSVTYTNYNGRIVCENRGGVETFFMPDTLGNVIETRDMATGVRTSETTYWPYGEVRTQTGTNPSPWGFCGVWGYYSAPGEPMYVRRGYYKPNVGTFLTSRGNGITNNLKGGSFFIMQDDPLMVIEPPYRFHPNSSCIRMMTERINSLDSLTVDRQLGAKIGSCMQKCIADASLEDLAKGKQTEPFRKCAEKCLGNLITGPAGEILYEYTCCVATSTKTNRAGIPIDPCTERSDGFCSEACCAKLYCTCMIKARITRPPQNIAACGEMCAADVRSFRGCDSFGLVKQ